MVQSEYSTTPATVDQRPLISSFLNLVSQGFAVADLSVGSAFVFGHRLKVLPLPSREFYAVVLVRLNPPAYRRLRAKNRNSLLWLGGRFDRG